MSCSFLLSQSYQYFKSCKLHKFSLFIKSHRTCYLHHILLQLFPHIVLFSVHKLVSPKGCRFLEKGDFIFYLSSMLNLPSQRIINFCPLNWILFALNVSLTILTKNLLLDETPWPYYKYFQMVLWSKASIYSSNWSFEFSES